jgi:hypothetical protein
MAERFKWVSRGFAAKEQKLEARNWLHLQSQYGKAKELLEEEGDAEHLSYERCWTTSIAN